MKRHPNEKGYARPGTNRAARLHAEDVLRVRPRTVVTPKLPDATGLKLLIDPRTFFEGDGARTPYGAKLIARRRAAGKAAKLARRKNR